MNQYRMKATGQIVTEAEYRRNTDKMLPAVLSPDDADVIFPSPAPTIDSNTQTAYRSGIVQTTLSNGTQVWVWDWTITDKPAEQVETELSAAKLAKNTQINTWRGEANSSTFSHLGKLIACDALSRSDIDAVAGSVSLTGAFPAGFPNGWKCTDNTYIALPTIDSFKEMYASMTLAGTQNFGKSQQLKAALAAATTVEQVAAIVWE